MTRKRTSLAMVALVLVLDACAGQPATNGATQATEATHDGAADRGAEYARRVCAGCHAVEAGESQSPNPNAPAFEVVANIPGMTAIALNAWLHSPHPSMPNLVVDPQSRNDLSAYLQSLQHSDPQG